MASPDDELEYLSPSFDPSSLTMPRLRNVLMSHDIAYPASAKKAQLVDIFSQMLKPKARNILAARDRVRRTSRGILDMPSSQEGTVIGDNDEDARSMLPPPTPKQRQSRKSTRPSAESGSLEPPIVSRASGGRRSSSKHARQSDTETDRDTEPQRPSLRKSRKSEATPKVKVEDSSEAPIRPPMRGGVFSDENPFQSGSSPLAPGEHRRRTAGSSVDKRKSSSGRRKSEGVTPSTTKQQGEFTPPSSKNFEVPVSRIRQSAVKDEPDDGLEAGEDFTPEEQLELVRDRAASGKRDIFPPRKQRRPQKFGVVPRSAPWVIFLSLLGGYATWWRQEKLAVGYCGIGRPSNALSSVHIPQWASTLQPTCEPCPQHAICYEGMETRCADDFVVQANPLSFGGLVPLPPTCEPDGEKVRRIKSVADRAVEELRERKAQAECGTLKDDKGKTVQEEIDEQDLKKEVGRRRRKDMSDAEFNDLWKGAIGEIKGREEIVSSSDGTRLSTTSFARLPLGCAVRRSARHTLAKYRLSLSFITIFISGLLYIRAMIITSRRDTARVPSLVATTLDRLATQAALHARGAAAESWISVGQLRDDVLRDEFSDKRRESMWKRVRVVVERNANVRASSRELRGGDVSRVWEWIGSVGLLDEAWSGGRGSGGGKRVSFGGLVDGGTLDGTGIPSGGEMVEQRKWDEGRPIY